MTLDDPSELIEPGGGYTSKQIDAIVDAAKIMGFPFDKGSYVKQLTIRQLDRLIRGEFDA